MPPATDSVTATPSALGAATSAARLVGPAATVVRRTRGKNTVAARTLTQSVCEQRAVRAGVRLDAASAQPRAQLRRLPDLRSWKRRRRRRSLTLQYLIAPRRHALLIEALRIPLLRRWELAEPNLLRRVLNAIVAVAHVV